MPSLFRVWPHKGREKKGSRRSDGHQDMSRTTVGSSAGESVLGRTLARTAGLSQGGGDPTTGASHNSYRRRLPLEKKESFRGGLVGEGAMSPPPSASQGDADLSCTAAEGLAAVDHAVQHHLGGAPARDDHPTDDDLLLAGGPHAKMFERLKAPIHIAAERGCECMLQLLLGAGAGEKDTLDRAGRTPLHLAVFSGKLPAVQALLAAGADATQRFGDDDSSAVESAARLGYVDILRAIIQHAPESALNASGSTGRTPLHEAARYNRVGAFEVLLEAGADKNALDRNGRTPLHLAAYKGHLDAAQALLAAGADATRLYKHGDHEFSAIGSAAGLGHEAVVRAFVQHGVDVNAAGCTGRTALHEAARGDKAGTITLLLGAGAERDALDSKMRTPLHHAAVKGHLAATEALLAADADATLRYGKDNSTAMEWAAYKGHVRVLRAFILHGADMNASGCTGRTALHEAARNNQASAVNLLLEVGAATDMLDSEGGTPLHLASQKGHIAVVEALLTAGASADLRYGNDDASAMEWAAYKGHADVVGALVLHGVDVNAAGSTGLTALHEAARRNSVAVISLLLEAGADKDALDGQGRAPLHLAAMHGHVAAARSLLAAGADATIRFGNDSASAMDWAAYKGQVEVIRAMIEHGVDADSAGPTGLTALHEAARKDQAGVVDFLLEAGANVNPQRVSGSTPLHFALANGSSQATLSLLKRGAIVDLRDSNGRTPLHAGSMKAGKYGVADCVDLMLRWGADEASVDGDGATAADLIGRRVGGDDLMPEEFERVRKLLESAPADKAWRRRGLLVLCRAHPDRLRLTEEEGGPRHAATGLKTSAGGDVPSDGQTDGAVDGVGGDGFGGVAATLLDFQIDGVFRNVMGYL